MKGRGAVIREQWMATRESVVQQYESWTLLCRGTRRGTTSNYHRQWNLTFKVIFFTRQNGLNSKVTMLARLIDTLLCTNIIWDCLWVALIAMWQHCQKTVIILKFNS